MAAQVIYTQGAHLQNYNNQLVGCLEDLKEQRDCLNLQILKEEEEKAIIHRDMAALTEKLTRIKRKLYLESLDRKIVARNEYDRTIQETEGAYLKILESSQTLLQVLKREGLSLAKRSSDV
jgi:Sjoegren syndrome nuclear autoantigen 1